MSSSNNGGSNSNRASSNSGGDSPRNTSHSRQQRDSGDSFEANSHSAGAGRLLGTHKLQEAIDKFSKTIDGLSKIADAAKGKGPKTHGSFGALMDAFNPPDEDEKDRRRGRAYRNGSSGRDSSRNGGGSSFNNNETFRAREQFGTNFNQGRPNIGGTFQQIPGNFGGHGTPMPPMGGGRGNNGGGSSFGGKMFGGALAGATAGGALYRGFRDYGNSKLQTQTSMSEYARQGSLGLDGDVPGNNQRMLKQAFGSHNKNLNSIALNPNDAIQGQNMLQHSAGTPLLNSTQRGRNINKGAEAYGYTNPAAGMAGAGELTNQMYNPTTSMKMQMYGINATPRGLGGGPGATPGQTSKEVMQRVFQGRSHVSAKELEASLGQGGSMEMSLQTMGLDPEKYGNTLRGYNKLRGKGMDDKKIDKLFHDATRGTGKTQRKAQDELEKNGVPKSALQSQKNLNSVRMGRDADTNKAFTEGLEEATDALGKFSRALTDVFNNTPMGAMAGKGGAWGAMLGGAMGGMAPGFGMGMGMLGAGKMFGGMFGRGGGRGGGHGGSGGRGGPHGGGGRGGGGGFFGKLFGHGGARGAGKLGKLGKFAGLGGKVLGPVGMALPWILNGATGSGRKKVADRAKNKGKNKGYKNDTIGKTEAFFDQGLSDATFGLTDSKMVRNSPFGWVGNSSKGVGDKIARGISGIFGGGAGHDAYTNTGIGGGAAGVDTLVPANTGIGGGISTGNLHRFAKDAENTHKTEVHSKKQEMEFSKEMKFSGSLEPPQPGTQRHSRAAVSTGIGGGDLSSEKEETEESKKLEKNGADPRANSGSKDTGRGKGEKNDDKKRGGTHGGSSHTDRPTVSTGIGGGDIGDAFGKIGDAVKGAAKSVGKAASGAMGDIASVSGSVMGALDKAITGDDDPSSAAGGGKDAKKKKKGKQKQSPAAVALSMVGKTKYTWGGVTKRGGVDCAGLNQVAWQAAGVKLPRTAKQQQDAVEPVEADEQKLKPGDLLFNKEEDATHTAIYVGKGQVVEAGQTGEKVKKKSFSKKEWKAAGRPSKGGEGAASAGHGRGENDNTLPGDEGRKTNTGIGGGGSASGMVAKAASQVGQGDSGGDNVNKYSKWYGMPGAPWCDMFVSWVAKESDNEKEVGKFAYTVAHANWFKGKKQWHEGSEGIAPGDIVFYDWGGGKSISGIDHVEIVEKAGAKGTIHTIAGNSGPKVKRNTRSGNIVGYGRPKYSGGSGNGEAKKKEDDTSNSSSGGGAGSPTDAFGSVEEKDSVGAALGGGAGGGSTPEKKKDDKKDDSFNGKGGKAFWGSSYWDNADNVGQSGSTGAQASGRKMSAKSIASPHFPLYTELDLTVHGKTQRGVVEDYGPADFVVNRHKGKEVIDLNGIMISRFLGKKDNPTIQENVEGTFKVVKKGTGKGFKGRKTDWSKYDIGAMDVKKDQVAEIHEGEMILPKREAETFRDAMTKKFLSEPPDTINPTLGGKKGRGNGSLGNITVNFTSGAIVINAGPGSNGASLGRDTAREFIKAIREEEMYDDIASGVK